MKYYMRIAVIAFLFGIIAPFVISIISMMASFDIGVSIGKFAIPLSSVEGISDSLIEIGNGVIYAVIAVTCAAALRKSRDS